LILVLPASSPSADWNTMVIFGPSLRIRATATHTPSAAARIGMSQTGESRVCFLGTALASGTEGIGGSRSGISNLFGACGIPDQPRIEGLDRKHCQHHHRREEKQPRPRSTDMSGLVPARTARFDARERPSEDARRQ
jgi:hypothetical protein